MPAKFDSRTFVRIDHGYEHSRAEQDYKRVLDEARRADVTDVREISEE